jgi:hypothetical protein
MPAFISKLKPDMNPENLRLVAFVQEADKGSALGAAHQERRPCAQYGSLMVAIQIQKNATG